MCTKGSPKTLNGNKTSDSQEIETFRNTSVTLSTSYFLFVGIEKGLSYTITRLCLFQPCTPLLTLPGWFVLIRKVIMTGTTTKCVYCEDKDEIPMTCSLGLAIQGAQYLIAFITHSIFSLYLFLVSLSSI